MENGPRLPSASTVAGLTRNHDAHADTTHSQMLDTDLAIALSSGVMRTDPAMWLEAPGTFTAVSVTPNAASPVHPCPHSALLTQ